MEYDWHSEQGIGRKVFYKRKFAFLRKVCICGTPVWWKHYYTKYIVYSSTYKSANDLDHVAYIEDITEDTYLVRKLADNL